MSSKKDDEKFYSLKCGVSSFFAKYVVAIFHPLELLKTRFQSIPFIITTQAMMGNFKKIWFPSTRALSKESLLSIKLRDSPDSIKVSTYLPLFLPLLVSVSFGCKTLLIKLWEEKVTVWAARIFSHDGHNLCRDNG